MISRPEQDGEQQVRLLADAWDQAAEYWRDGPARQFGEGPLAAALQESRGYLEALRTLMDLLEAAERETAGLAPGMAGIRPHVTVDICPLFPAGRDPR